MPDAVKPYKQKQQQPTTIRLGPAWVYGAAFYSKGIHLSKIDQVEKLDYLSLITIIEGSPDGFG